MASVEDLRRARDGDTTSASKAPASELPNEADEEDRTVQQTVGRPSSPDHGTEVSAQPPVTPLTPKRGAPIAPRPAAPAVPAPPSSRKMTAVGLGAPPPATRPTADVPKTPPPIEPIDEENDITATAPAPKVSVPRLPIAPPGTVEIRTLADE